MSNSNVKMLMLKIDKIIIGELFEDEKLPGAVLIKQPVQVLMMPPSRAGDSGTIAFLPFLEFSEEFKTGIVFSPNDIVTVVTPVIDLYNKYNEIFGSGIQIADASSNIVPIRK